MRVNTLLALSRSSGLFRSRSRRRIWNSPSWRRINCAGNAICYCMNYQKVTRQGPLIRGAPQNSFETLRLVRFRTASLLLRSKQKESLSVEGQPPACVCLFWGGGGQCVVVTRGTVPPCEQTDTTENIKPPPPKKNYVCGR